MVPASRTGHRLSSCAWEAAPTLPAWSALILQATEGVVQFRKAMVQLGIMLFIVGIGGGVL